MTRFGLKEMGRLLLCLFLQAALLFMPISAQAIASSHHLPVSNHSHAMHAASMKIVPAVIDHAHASAPLKKRVSCQNRNDCCLPGTQTPDGLVALAIFSSPVLTSTRTGFAAMPSILRAGRSLVPTPPPPKATL